MTRRDGRHAAGSKAALFAALALAACSPAAGESVAPHPRAAAPPPTEAASSAILEERIDAADWWRSVEPLAYADLDEGKWAPALARLTDPHDARRLRLVRPARVHDLEDAILRAAAPAGDAEYGLWNVFRQARDQRRSKSPTDQETARRTIEWASSRALLPYGRDRAAFEHAYRAVRFGDGRLDVAGNSPVRSFAFEEAAARLEQTSPLLDTWCYERRLRRKCRELREDAETWDRFVEELNAGAATDDGTGLGALLDAATQRSVRFLGSTPASAKGLRLRVEEKDGAREVLVRWSKVAPARLAESLTLPRLGALTPKTVAGLARIFAETGDGDAAKACAANAVGRDSRLRDDVLDAEIDALGGLVSARRVPADVVERAELSAWAQAHGDTDAAHAVGGLGSRDVGAFDDDAVDAFVEGGVLWAPEQWATARRRLDQARAEKRLGLDGWSVESDHFTIWTDVSPKFAAQASLVLDAGYEQTALEIGIVPAAKQSAVVFKRHEDYVARFHNRSGGCWDPVGRTVYAYLYDPSHPSFARFHFPTLLHEAAHAALGSGSSGDVPSWMHEGVACCFERWNPSRSVHANAIAAGTSLTAGCRSALKRTRDDLPKLEDLLAIRRGWDVDEFGPKTLARYAAAESLLVHLTTDPARRRIFDRFVDATRHGLDPAACLSDSEKTELAKSWNSFIDESTRRR